MQLRWTAEAANDLERIADYLFEHAPDRAAELVRSVYDAPAALLTFPNRGRLGKKEGTRELVLSPLTSSSSTPCAAIRYTSFASCTARSGGHDKRHARAGLRVPNRPARRNPCPSGPLEPRQHTSGQSPRVTSNFRPATMAETRDEIEAGQSVDSWDGEPPTTLAVR